VRAKLIENIEFERGLEPADAMNIGIKEDIQKWVNKTWYETEEKWYHHDNINTVIYIMAENNKTEYLKYVIEEGYTDNNDTLQNKMFTEAITHKNEELIEYYLEKKFSYKGILPSRKTKLIAYLIKNRKKDESQIS